MSLHPTAFLRAFHQRILDAVTKVGCCLVSAPGEQDQNSMSAASCLLIRRLPSTQMRTKATDSSQDVDVSQVISGLQFPYAYDPRWIQTLLLGAKMDPVLD
jgi:hypothetical protein